MTDVQPQLDINLLIQRYASEIAQLSQRAIHAEAELIQLRLQNENQAQVIESFAKTEEQPSEGE